LQRQRYKFYSTYGNFPERAPIRELHVAFKMVEVRKFITQLWRQQTEGIQIHENARVLNTEQGEALHRKCNKFNFGGSRAHRDDYARNGLTTG
jgi:hypothetical protein